MLHTAIANRTQELAFIRSFRFIPLISLSGYMFFPTLQIHVFAAVFRFTPHRFTTTHIHPFRSFAPIHSIRSLLPALAFSNAPFGQKNAPNQLPAAPCHRALRYLCQGHSLHSHRLALQRTGLILRSVSLLSHFSLAIHAGSRLFFLFRFKPASPTPTPDHPPLRKNAVDIYQEFKMQEFDSTTKKMFTKITAIKCVSKGQALRVFVTISTPPVGRVVF